MPEKIDFNDRMLSLGLARVSEAAALASARLIGRGDEKAADQAAVDAMRKQLNLLDIAGVVVIGEGERDEAPMLYIGEEVGTGKGPAVDIALDPLEGTTLTAKDMPNALAVIAMWHELRQRAKKSVMWCLVMLSTQNLAICICRVLLPSRVAVPKAPPRSTSTGCAALAYRRSSLRARRSCWVTATSRLGQALKT